MQLIMGVRDFGKIGYAEVSIHNFSVFVGNNNSGKTYLMQLIYGVYQNLRYYIYDFQSSHLELFRKEIVKGRIVLDIETAKALEAFLNEILEKNKEKIVFGTFNENISIGRLYIKICFDQDEKIEYLLWTSGNQKEALREIEKKLYLSEKRKQEMMKKITPLFQSSNRLVDIMLRNRLTDTKKEFQKLSMTLNEKEEDTFHNVVKEMCETIFAYSNNMLFMPASRTGLLMLYKEFFAQKADKAVQILNSDEINDSKEERIGLTQPVYEFLRFVQTFRSNEMAKEKNKELIRFMEEHLIEGKLFLNQGNQVFYQGKGSDKEIPLYLSSSMINELTPVLYALQSIFGKSYIIWDEIETSLHPQKQMELVRLLNRMNNKGIRLIVSTHSDTMAAKINNLCMLSYSESLRGRREELLKKAGLESEDLLQNKIYVYQFTNDENGKSYVSEVSYNEFTGYEFTQFNDSVEKLFQETKLIME